MCLEHSTWHPVSASQQPPELDDLPTICTGGSWGRRSLSPSTQLAGGKATVECVCLQSIILNPNKHGRVYIHV